jgi:hypothetical protein
MGAALHMISSARKVFDRYESASTGKRSRCGKLRTLLLLCSALRSVAYVHAYLSEKSCFDKHCIQVFILCAVCLPAYLWFNGSIEPLQIDFIKTRSQRISNIT